MDSNYTTLKKMGNETSSTWTRNYRELKLKHDAAYRIIDEAITLEEQQRPNDAVDKYKVGIATIDNALNIVVSCPDNPDTTWTEACNMVQKMKRTRAEILIRINSITTTPGYMHHEPPPSYEAATASNENSLRTYKDLADALKDLHINTSELPTNIIFTTNDVRFYCISPHGEVLSTSENQTLHIAVIEGGQGEVDGAYLQIGNWIYPLIPGVSPCYRTNFRAFILPDVHSDLSGSSIGFIVAEEDDAIVLDLLEDILYGVISEESQEKDKLSRKKRAEPGISSTISKGIINSAYYISKGLIYGAQKTGELLNYGTPKVLNNLEKADEAAVSENVKKGVKIAEKTTSKAAEITGYVAEGIGNATCRLGHFLAPHLQKQGTRLLTSNFNISEQEASEKMNGVLTVAAGAVEGFATVYKGLETSASILGNNLKDNSVKIVEHKYGKPAGEVAHSTLNTVGNVINIRGNTRFFTPKGLAKKTAKDTGIALVRDYHSGVTEVADAPSTSNALYPNLNDAKSLEEKK